MSNFVKIKDKIINMSCVNYIWTDIYYLYGIDYYELGFKFNFDSSVTIHFKDKDDLEKVINSLSSDEFIRIDSYIININMVSCINELDDKIVIMFKSGDHLHIGTLSFPKFNFRRI